MRRLAAMVCASLVLAGLLLVPLAAGVSAATASAAGFACDPHGTTGGSPTTTLSSVRIDTTTPANSQLTCLFRGTRLPLSTGGTCHFGNGTFLVEFSHRTLLPVNNNTNLICSGATSVSLKTDLSIAKTHSGDVVAGQATTYTIVVTNAGANPGNGVVTDALPAAIGSDTYTSVAAGGATGNTASGSSNINDTLSLPVGASVTYTVVANVDPTARGTLANTATVAAGANTVDTNSANNSATDSAGIGLALAVSIGKTDGVTTVTAGGSTTYTITVEETGPSAVDGCVLIDALPVGVTSATWSATNGHSGTGAIDDNLGNLLNTTVTYTMIVQISPSATGTLSNTAILASSDFGNPTVSFIDTDTITPAP